MVARSLSLMSSRDLRKLLSSCRPIQGAMMKSILSVPHIIDYCPIEGASRITVAGGGSNLKFDENEGTHPLDADLAAYAVGKLPDLRAALMEHHLSQCDRCARVVANAPNDRFVELLQKKEAAHVRQSDQRMTSRQVFDDGKVLRELRNHPRYRMIRRLGVGGMANVYLAEHRILKNSIALKTIHPDRACEKEIFDRFLREAKAVARLSHTNIARVIDVEMMGDSPILAMEFVPGKTLAEVVAQKGPLPIRQACHYVRQAALGLQHASDRGVIHRDIKPQNLMLTPKGVVKILDFGLGRLVDDKRTHAGITKDNEMLGTPHYVAPEQARDAKSADIRSDIYGLGCTLYFLLTGETPFSGQSVLEVLAKHEYELPKSVASIRQDVPIVVAELIEKMLAKDPSGRPQTPREIAAVLSSYCAAPNVVTKDDSTLSRRRPEIESGQSLWGQTRSFLSPAVILPLLTILACLIASFGK